MTTTTEILATIRSMTDRRTGLAPMIPAVFDRLQVTDPALTEQQYHALLIQMERDDLGTLQAWGSSDDELQETGYPISRFPCRARGGRAAWFAPRR